MYLYILILLITLFLPHKSRFESFPNRRERFGKDYKDSTCFCNHSGKDSPQLGKIGKDSGKIQPVETMGQ